MWSLFTMLTPFLLASTAPTWPPQTASDLSQNFKQLYRDLSQSGPISRHMSPTLRFSYVSPPVNATFTWRNVVEEEDLAVRPGDVRRPLAVYLPGLDGYGISAAQNQFNDLANAFELWRLTVLPEDMSTFVQVVSSITSFVEHVASDGRQVVLIGESCGGLLASAVALRLKRSESLKGLVLVNPATSFEQTDWDTLVPILTSLQYLDTRAESQRNEGLSPYAILGSLMLSALIPDSEQQRRIFDMILGLPSLENPNPEKIRDLFDSMADALRGTEERLPPHVLEHRVIKWLLAGASAVNSRLSQIEVATLVVAGQEDRLMPSSKEAERLVNVMPNAEKLLVRGRGHFVLDDSVNLTEAILYSMIDPLDWKSTRRYDPIRDWKRPSRLELEKVVQDSVKPLRTAHSPVFFSTDDRGKRWLGLSKIPRPEGPLLFVGNHQFAALDLRLLMPELIEERNIFPRGLAHPVTFNPNQVGELGGRTPGIANGQAGNPFNGDFQKFGAVMVTPRNYYRLLQTGQDCLLFPGGAKEALSGSKEYPLFWPKKVDFVRTAAKFNATIIPFSAVGVVDSVNVVIELEDVFKLPIIGERARNASASVKSARFDQSNEDEALGFPIFVPSLPQRCYFLFGPAISTTDIDPTDKEACAKIYRQTQAFVRSGLDDIMSARQSDPFKNTPIRLAFERVFGKKAPTFPIELLNRK